jgi:hypothetical protein
MPRVLLVGYDPETVDFSNPALPPGMTIEKIRAGIAATLEQMTDRGWEADVCLIRPDETAGQTVERHLASASCDCVVIGAGVRLPPQGLALFEAVVTRSTGRPRLPRLLSTRGPRTAPMLLPDGCRPAECLPSIAPRLNPPNTPMNVPTNRPIPPAGARTETYYSLITTALRVEPPTQGGAAAPPGLTELTTGQGLGQPY